MSALNTAADKAARRSATDKTCGVTSAVRYHPYLFGFLPLSCARSPLLLNVFDFQQVERVGERDMKGVSFAFFAKDGAIAEPVVARSRGFAQ